MSFDIATEKESTYTEIGIRKSVLDFGNQIEAGLKERFRAIDETAEYNQLKVIRAMQENRVSEGCFNYASGYGYNDQGRDTLEAVYASAFHTEAALVRPQITCGTHALALALSATWVPSRTSTDAVAAKASACFLSLKVFSRRLPALSV